MPRRRSAETTPDLFSAASTAKAPEHPAVSQGKTPPGNLASKFRHLLPKDLTGALKHLDDAEVDSLLAAVISEAKRRGLWPRASAPKSPTPEDARGSLTTGKLNAVRAAFKAGVKPAAIARQFGMSPSDVRQALASERRDRTSRR